jgi:SAM-dependent methyltransferase
MSKRWNIAQNYERDVWQNIRERILSPEYIESKKKYSKNILTWLNEFKTITEESSILQVGSAGEGEIFFFNIGRRYAIDPLADFYIKSFGKIQDNRVVFLKGAGEALPYKNNFFDIVIIFNVLDHVDRPSDVLNEIYKVLKPGGIAYIGVHAYSFTGRSYRKIREFIHNIDSNIKIDQGHPHSFSPNGLKKMICKDFQIIDTKHDEKEQINNEINFYNTLKRYLLGQKMYRFIVKKNG